MPLSRERDRDRKKAKRRSDFYKQLALDLNNAWEFCSSNQRLVEVYTAAPPDFGPSCWINAHLRSNYQRITPKREGTTTPEPVMGAIVQYVHNNKWDLVDYSRVKRTTHFPCRATHGGHTGANTFAAQELTGVIEGQILIQWMSGGPQQWLPSAHVTNQIPARSHREQSQKLSEFYVGLVTKPSWYMYMGKNRPKEKERRSPSKKRARPKCIFPGCSTFAHSRTTNGHYCCVHGEQNLCVHCNWRVVRCPGNNCEMCYEYTFLPKSPESKTPTLPPFIAQPLLPPPLPPPVKPSTFPPSVEYTRGVDHSDELQHNNAFLRVKLIGENHLPFVIRVQCMWRIALAIRNRNTKQYWLTEPKYCLLVGLVSKVQCAIRHYLARRVLVKGVTSIQKAIRCYLARRRLAAKVSVGEC
jgi:hypothetical protein